MKDVLFTRHHRSRVSSNHLFAQEDLSIFTTEQEKFAFLYNESFGKFS